MRSGEREAAESEGAAAGALPARWGANMARGGPAMVLALQRTIGNRSVTRLLGEAATGSAADGAIARRTAPSLLRQERKVVLARADKNSETYLRGYNDGRANNPSAPGPLNDEAMADYDAGYADGSAESEREHASLPPVTKVPRLDVPIELERDEELGRIAGGEEGGAREEAAEQEIERRTLVIAPSQALPAPAGPPGPAGSTMVSPDVALKILDNVAKGDTPFIPAKGKGGCSWFVTEGAPYTGIDPAKNVPVQVDITETPGKLVFRESDLQKLMAEMLEKTAAEAEIAWRERFRITQEVLSSKNRKSLARFSKAFAESRMWDRVGEMVRGSETKVGEVVLEPGSVFSKTPGKFAVVADASKIKLRGGVGPLVEAVKKAGVPEAEGPVLEAATKLGEDLKWAGRVKGAFRYGGRVLIVVAIAADVYKIYRAKDHWKAVTEVAGGWAGATATGAAFGAWFAPGDAAGPWAWLAHGVGTLAAGAVGYFAGSKITKKIYELVIDD